MPHLAEEKQKPLPLPQGFLLGAASSSHQVEGLTTNNDWWHYEQQGKLPKSGPATDHYHRFAEDFGLAQQIGLNALRLSIEWSRIEPQPGQWDMAAVAHYREVLQTLKNLDLTTMVTLHHFTLPWWLAQQGGFANRATVKKFSEYAQFIAQQLGTEIDLWCTINEPDIYSFMGYKQGQWPPFQKSVLAMWRVLNNLIAGHKAVYQAIKTVLPGAQIGLAKNNTHYEAYRPDNLFDRLAVTVANYINQGYLLNQVQSSCDFIGLNYYFHQVLKFHPLKFYEPVKQQGPVTDLGWPIYPQGLYYLLKQLRKYHKPIYITENGLADASDSQRADYIGRHLTATAQALAEGVDVRGYFYWSLTDTYEWQDGYKPKFGLIEIDFASPNLTRRIRPSANIFKQLP